MTLLTPALNTSSVELATMHSRPSGQAAGEDRNPLSVRESGE